MMLLLRAVLIFPLIKISQNHIFFCTKYRITDSEKKNPFSQTCRRVVYRHHHVKKKGYRTVYNKKTQNKESLQGFLCKSKSHASHMVNCVYSSSITIVMGLPSLSATSGNLIYCSIKYKRTILNNIVIS